MLGSRLDPELEDAEVADGPRLGPELEDAEVADGPWLGPELEDAAVADGPRLGPELEDAEVADGPRLGPELEDAEVADGPRLGPELEDAAVARLWSVDVVVVAESSGIGLASAEWSSGLEWWPGDGSSGSGGPILKEQQNRNYDQSKLCSEMFVITDLATIPFLNCFAQVNIYGDVAILEFMNPGYFQNLKKNLGTSLCELCRPALSVQKRFQTFQNVFNEDEK